MMRIRTPWDCYRGQPEVLEVRRRCGGINRHSARWRRACVSPDRRTAPHSLPFKPPHLSQSVSIHYLLAQSVWTVDEHSPLLAVLALTNDHVGCIAYLAGPLASRTLHNPLRPASDTGFCRPNRRPLSLLTPHCPSDHLEAVVCHHSAGSGNSANQLGAVKLSLDTKADSLRLAERKGGSRV